MEDRSPEIIRLVTTILEQSNAALARVRQVSPAAFDKAAVASELLVVLHTADELVDFFDPPMNPLEYHGAPRSMTELEDPPQLILRSEDGFDFLPWYCEKSSSLKQEATSVVSTWRRDLNQVQPYPADSSTPAEAFVADLVRHLEGVQAYAQVIFDVTSERRVMVQEIRFRPEDSN